MGQIALRRALSMIPLGLGVVLLVSLFLHAIPGDPVDILAGDYATEEQKEDIRRSLGLHEPLHEQVLKFLGNVLRGDLGTSLITKRPVRNLILERLRATVELALTSLLTALVISLPLGILSAVRAGTWLDHASMFMALFGICIPHFWLGPLLILFFSLELDWLPVSERTHWQSYILPSLTLGSSLAAILTRMTRTTILETLQEDYVRTARAKGNPESHIILKHVLKNAALPLVTLLGLQLGVLLTGTIITETIFDWPGLGTLLLHGISSRDYPLVQGCVLVFSGIYLAVNLMTDLIYLLLDPRIRL